MTYAASERSEILVTVGTVHTVRREVRSTKHPIITGTGIHVKCYSSPYRLGHLLTGSSPPQSLKLGKFEL